MSTPLPTAWNTNHTFVTHLPTKVDYGPSNTFEEILITPGTGSKTDEHMIAYPALWTGDCQPCSKPCSPDVDFTKSPYKSQQGIYSLSMNFAISEIPAGVSSNLVKIDQHTGIVTVSSDVKDVCKPKNSAGVYDILDSLKHGITLTITPSFLIPTKPPPDYPITATNVHNKIPSVTMHVSWVWVSCWPNNFTAVLGHNANVKGLPNNMKNKYFITPRVSSVLTRDSKVTDEIATQKNQKPQSAFSFADGYANGFDLDFSLQPVAPAKQLTWANEVKLLSEPGIGCVQVQSDIHGKESTQPQQAIIVITPKKGGRNDGYAISPLPISIKWLNYDNYSKQVYNTNQTNMGFTKGATAACFGKFIENELLNSGHIMSHDNNIGDNEGVWGLPTRMFRNPTDIGDAWDSHSGSDHPTKHANVISAKVASSSDSMASQCAKPLPPLVLPPTKGSSQAENLGKAMSAMGVTTCTTETAGGGMSFFGMGGGASETVSTGCESVLATSSSYNTNVQTLNCQINSIKQSSTSSIVVNQTIRIEAGDITVKGGGQINLSQYNKGDMVSQTALQNQDQQQFSATNANSIKDAASSVQTDSAGWGSTQQGSKTIKTLSQNLNNTTDSQNINQVVQTVFSTMYTAQGVVIKAGTIDIEGTGSVLNITQSDAVSLVSKTLATNVFSTSFKAANISDAISSMDQSLVNKNHGMFQDLGIGNPLSEIILAIIVIAGLGIVGKGVSGGGGDSGSANGNPGKFWFKSAGVMIFLAVVAELVIYFVEKDKKKKKTWMIVIGVLTLLLAIIFVIVGVVKNNKISSMPIKGGTSSVEDEAFNIGEKDPELLAAL